MSSRLATSKSQAERAEAAFSQRHAMAERLSAARERGETISIDIAQDPHNLAMFMRYAEEYGGNSAAAHALMDAELARQGLRPTLSFTDGSALPTSFGDLRERYERSRLEPQMDVNLDSVHRRNDVGVSSQRSPAPRIAVEPAPTSTTRTDIQHARARLHSQTGTAAGSFDSKAEIVQAPDGTLKSKRSLFKQTVKQVAGDADVSLDAAKDAVKGIVKRDK